MLKTGIVDGDNRALSEKKPISMPQEVKTPDSSLSQQDKQLYTYNYSTDIIVILYFYIYFAVMMIRISYEPVHEISNNVVCATNKASDQPAHWRSLIRAFASRLSIL